MKYSSGKARSFWRQTLLIIGLCLILTLAITLWLRSVRHDLLSTYSRPDNSAPDFFARQVSVSVYDDLTGTLSSKLKARQIEHYPISGNTWLTSPVIWKFDDKNGLRLHAVSKKGQIFSDRKTFRLYDHVVVTHPSNTGAAPVTLKTNEMTIDTGRHLAQTSRAVHIVQDGSEVNSTGLKYDYRNNIVELKSKVKGVSKPDL